jgi:hypothetical protein
MIRGDLYKAFQDEYFSHRMVEDPSSFVDLGHGARIGRLPPAMDLLRTLAVWIRTRYPAEAEAVLTSLWEDIKSVAPGGGRLPADTPPPWPPA